MSSHSDESVKSDSSKNLNLTPNIDEIISLVASRDDFVESHFKIHEEENYEEKSSSDDEEIQENNLDSIEESKNNTEKSSKKNNEEEEEINLSSAERLDMIAKIKKLWEDRKHLKWKNSFLHKKSRDLLKKRKFVNYFEKSNIFSTIHSDPRYEAALREFEGVKNSLETSNKNLAQVSEDSKKFYGSREIEFEKSFGEFRIRFFEVGIEALKKKDSKLSQVNKKIAGLLMKMQSRMENLRDTRVVFFKLKIILKNINSELSKINILGEGYTVSEYENLAMIKDSHMEILNKREKKIDTHHNKSVAIINTLSQVKEQLRSLENDILVFKKKLEELEEIKNKLQVEFNKLRRQRDFRRRKILSQQQKLFSVTPELIKEISKCGAEYAKLKSKIQGLEESNNN